MRKTLLATALLGALALPVSASAITISGITLPEGAFLDIGTLYAGTEGSDGALTVTATGDVLVGIGIVDAIKDENGAVVWTSGDNGRELNFYFDNYLAQAINVIGVGPTPINVLFSGGDAHFYDVPTGTFAFTSPASFAADSAAIAAAGPLWMDTTGGFTRDCVLADGCDDGIGTDISLELFILSGTLGSIGVGTASGFLDVTGAGLADSVLDTNSLVGGHDLVLTSSFNSGGSTAGYGASGSIDARGRVSVPEPRSVGLLGLGLVGLAGFSRIRKSI